jgi:hypothetical protein
VPVCKACGVTAGVRQASWPGPNVRSCTWGRSEHLSSAASIHGRSADRSALHWPMLRDELPIDESSTLRFLDQPSRTDRRWLGAFRGTSTYLRLNLKFVSFFTWGKRSNVLPTDRLVSVHFGR